MSLAIRMPVAFSRTATISPLSRLGSAAGLALLAAAWASPAAAQATSPDLAFTTKATTGAGASATSTLERFLISGSHIRMEMSEDPPNPALGGTYNVLNLADSTQMSVMPQLHMAMLMKIPAGIGADLGLPTVTVSDITKDSIADLGPGDRVLGHETHHYRIVRAGTLETTTNGRTCSHAFDSIEEVWIATDAVPTTQLRSAERRMGSIFGESRGAGESWINVFDAAARTPPPRGLVLRSVRMKNTPGAAATPDSGSYTTEYTELSTAPLDSSLFTVPAGFQVQDMRGMNLGDMAGAMANAMARTTRSDSTSGCGG